MIKLKYVQPLKDVIILVNTLSDWQKDYLNKHLVFRDIDRIGSYFGGEVYHKLCFSKFLDGSSSWIMIKHPTHFPVVSFNDIFIEEK